MKRKAGRQAATQQSVKKKKVTTGASPEEIKKRFRDGLFADKVLKSYTDEYAESSPYKHGVIHELFNDSLLRSVRDEVKNNVSFTPKETDIYKIHQSGDLANLDGLDDDALAKLPSLLALRDAMYSESFRDYVAHVTGSGPLSGRKTDMAINVYTPGCYLLCHDDVIGSRRVSYILYLTDPDKPWQPEWGGALRLFPVDEIESKEAGGQVAKTPSPDVSKVIPPAWNQLSFFAVQPGHSFHDVEEVYHAGSPEELENQGGRVRMAISGWFHIPQKGEEGYVEGAEEKNARNSSLMQLQGNPDQYDRPQPRPIAVEDPAPSSTDDFDEETIEYLLQYMAPTYLTPDTLEQVSEVFAESSSITVPDLLNKKFADRLRAYVASQDSTPVTEDSLTLEKSGPWRVARPPHKHRYVYMQPNESAANGKSKKKGKAVDDASPIRELIEEFIPSRHFRIWLQVATGCVLENHDIMARRFRRGMDYTLATGHEGKPRLELNLGITPTSGWGGEDGAEDEEEDGDAEEEGKERSKTQKKSQQNGNGDSQSQGKKGKSKMSEAEAEASSPQDAEEVGGTEVYMAGDDGDDNEDAAEYKTSSGDDENILFFSGAGWNSLSLVLRDSGALRFVKYVSRRAPGDRWDVSASFDVEEDDDDDDDAEEEEEEVRGVQDDTEEEWNGFSPEPEDSDSD